MKRFSQKKLLLGIFISLFYAQSPLEARSTQPYVVSYRLPDNITCLNGRIPIYYGGFRVFFDDEGAALLPEKGSPLLFHLAIIKRIEPVESHNTIMYWQCPDKEPCALYELKLSLNRSEEGEIQDYRWDIKSFPQEQIPKRLPDNALLVLFDPELIDTLADDPTTHAPGSISLPALTFKKATKETFENALVWAAMAALDIDHFNRREHPLKVSKPATVLIPTEGF